MKYFKYLPDLNWRPVSKKLKWYVLEHDKTILAFDKPRNMWQNADKKSLLQHVPELLEMVRPLKLTIRYLAFFVTTTVDNAIHYDDTPIDYRINLPVLNCETTETRFYTTNSSPIHKTQANGSPYYYYAPENCVHVDSYCLTCPVVLRVDALHQVIHDPINIPRISFTIAFNEDISYLLND